MKTILHVEDVYKSYDGNMILDDIDLKVEEGEFVTVVGASGCGKSTLLRLILGQEQKTCGILDINGVSVSKPNKDRGIVFQRYSLFPNMSILDNVLLGKKLTSIIGWLKNKKAYRAEAIEFLETVGLGEHLHKFPHQLSGGMQQRVAVVQAMIMKPKILLMDEPFGALDPGTREDIQLFLIDQQQKHNMTIFFVTHDLEEAVFLGSRIIVLSRYYKDERDLSLTDLSHGAKIVADHHIEHLDNCTADEKRSVEFGELIADIRKEGFDSTHLQDITEFSLNHKHSFQTI